MNNLEKERPAPKLIHVLWERVNSHEIAQSKTEAVYIFDWHDSPYYIGMLGKAKFGGNRQRIQGTNKYLNPRYGSSYRHLVEGCLEHGAKLYFGTFPEGVAPPNLSQ